MNTQKASDCVNSKLHLMKSKRRWILLIFPLALFVWAWQAASWRPKLVGIMPTQQMNGFGMLPSTFSGPKLLISPDGKHLASVAALRTGYVLTMWAPASRQRLWQHENFTRQFPFAFSPDGRTLAVAEGSPNFAGTKITLNLVNTATGKSRVLRQKFWQTDLQSAAFLSNRALVAATSRGAIVVDTQTGKTIRQWNFDWPTFHATKNIRSQQSHVSADGTHVIALVTGTYNTALNLYNVKTGEHHEVWVPYLYCNPRLSPKGRFFALQYVNAVACDVFDSQTSFTLWKNVLGNQTDFPWSWSANGDHIMTLDAAPAINYTDARPAPDIQSVPAKANTESLAFDPSGDFLYTLDAGKIWRWRLR